MSCKMKFYGNYSSCTSHQHLRLSKFLEHLPDLASSANGKAAIAVCRLATFAKPQRHNPHTGLLLAHTVVVGAAHGASRGDTITDNFFFFFLSALRHFRWEINCAASEKYATPTPHPHPTLLHLNCIFVHLIRLRMDRQLQRRAKQEIWQLLKRLRANKLSFKKQITAAAPLSISSRKQGRVTPPPL